MPDDEQRRVADLGAWRPGGLTPEYLQRGGTEKTRAEGVVDDAGVPRTGVVPWETVTDAAGRPAWTAGQLRAALAHLADDDPVVVEVPGDEASVSDKAIITGAGPGRIAWGDGDGMEQDPLFALLAHWPAELRASGKEGHRL